MMIRKKIGEISHTLELRGARWIIVGGKTSGKPRLNMPISETTKRAAAASCRPFSCLFHWHVRPGFARGFALHGHCDHGYT